MTRGRRREEAVDLGEVETQPAPDAEGSEAVGVAIDPAAAHAEVASDLLDADEVGVIRRVVDELDEPLSDRLDVFAVERHTSQAADGRRLATIFSRHEPTKHTNRTSERERITSEPRTRTTREAPRASPDTDQSTRA
jgi:hypothetical protein